MPVVATPQATAIATAQIPSVKVPTRVTLVPPLSEAVGIALLTHRSAALRTKRWTLELQVKT